MKFESIEIYLKAVGFDTHAFLTKVLHKQVINLKIFAEEISLSKEAETEKVEELVDNGLDDRSNESRPEEGRSLSLATEEGRSLGLESEEGRSLARSARLPNEFLKQVCFLEY